MPQTLAQFCKQIEVCWASVGPSKRLAGGVEPSFSVHGPLHVLVAGPEPGRACQSTGGKVCAQFLFAIVDDSAAWQGEVRELHRLLVQALQTFRCALFLDTRWHLKNTLLG